MGYHDYSECTLNADERREEANRLVVIIQGSSGVDNLSEKEQGFLAQMEDGNVSVKQLFWLRDIKDKLN